MSAEVTWTDAEKAMLRQLRAAGESTADISRKMGRSVGGIQKMSTKLKLTPLVSRRPDAPAPSSVGLRALETALALHTERQRVVLPPVKRPAQLPIPAPRTCQWIEGDVKPQPQFCGCATVAGKSWCRTHLRRVFVQHAQQEAA